MTVAGKINALVIAIAATAGCLLTAHTTQSEYRLSLDRIIEQSSSSVLSQPQLQLDIYYLDTSALNRTLQAFIDSSPAIVFARVLDPSGKTLAAKGDTTAGFDGPYAFGEIRRDASPADQTLTSHDDDGAGILGLGGRVFDLRDRKSVV